MSSAASLADLGHQKYVRLTTFRRDGTPVRTPVWIVPDGDHVLVTTIDPTGKVKRLLHTSRVSLVACDMRGRVAPGTRETTASAELDWTGSELARLRRLIIAKYGIVARIYFGAEDAFIRFSRRTPKRRVMIRISAG